MAINLIRFDLISNHTIGLVKPRRDKSVPYVKGFNTSILNKIADILQTPFPFPFQNEKNYSSNVASFRFLRDAIDNKSATLPTKLSRNYIRRDIVVCSGCKGSQRIQPCGTGVLYKSFPYYWRVCY